MDGVPTGDPIFSIEILNIPVILMKNVWHYTTKRVDGHKLSAKYANFITQSF